MKRKSLFFSCFFAVLFLFSSCATTPAGKPPSLNYDWGSGTSSFTNIIYTTMDGSVSLDAQIIRMRTEIERIEGKIKEIEEIGCENELEIDSYNKLFPPGFFAHLGYLYLEARNRTEAIKCFEKEKELFPDSALFLDFLVNRNRRYETNQSSRPRTILIMPVINNTHNVDAPEIPFSVYPIVPLANAGYYVIPVALSAQTFIQEGAVVADEAHLIPHDKLCQIFGADAALYLRVTECGVSLSYANVRVAARLVDLRTGKDIWTGSGAASEKIGGTQTSGLGLFGALLDVAIAVNNARNVNYNNLGIRAARSLVPQNIHRTIGYGVYHPLFVAE